MKRIGVIGGGPAALFLLKHLLKYSQKEFEVLIFERSNQLGMGMPYSKQGAAEEHVTNVSGNEIPDLVQTVEEWIKHAPIKLLNRFHITPETYKDLKVMPRLFFGEYLSRQFQELLRLAKDSNVIVKVFLNTSVKDVSYDEGNSMVTISADNNKHYTVDRLVMCSGHTWPKINEGKISGWFDSPYPPQKLKLEINYPVAIKGASLTAIDAIKTLARENGRFVKLTDNNYQFILNKESRGFKLVLHSIKGLLPGVRFHLEDSHLSEGNTLDAGAIQIIKNDNGGFVPLDYIFDKYFKQPLLKKDKELYNQIKDMKMEAFVDLAMQQREAMNAFDLFRAECAEAELSIAETKSIQWKEWLAVLSYQLNYPAKHFSAEDMLRLQRKLKPLIAIIIAFVPQGSARELIALYNAGVLEIVAVDDKSEAVPVTEGGCSYSYQDENKTIHNKSYRLFIDAVGQKPVAYNDFPFASLREQSVISPAMLKFESTIAARVEKEKGNKDVVAYSPENCYLQLPGVNINDSFQVLDKFGGVNENIFVMAVPNIAGLNPDYSGLDFCDTASDKIVHAIFKEDLTEEYVAA